MLPWVSLLGFQMLPEGSKKMWILSVVEHKQHMCSYLGQVIAWRIWEAVESDCSLPGFIDGSVSKEGAFWISS